MYVDAKKIYDFSINCFTQSGMKEEDAKIVTDTMAVADSRGIHSHGFLRLPIYIERIKKGYITTNSHIDVIKEYNSITILDGQYAAGQVVGKTAMEASINKAKETGLGLTVVKNSNHFGIAAYYAAMAAEHNMVGIAISNVEPLMPAIGGAEKVIGNNPIAIAAPNNGGKDPIVLDMALSNVPLGKILVAAQKGESIPEGWAVNKNGEPTTDPADVQKGGFLYPVGGPKGFGLALMAEVLTGIISGGQYSKTIPSMYDLEEKQSISHFMLAIDLSVFLDEQDYSERIGNLTSFVKDSKKATGVDNTFLPGELEYMREKVNVNKGLPMDDKLLVELLKLSKDTGIPLEV